MQAASVSIMSNIAEGYERSSAAEFHRFLSIAKASCAEVRSELYVALDADHLTRPQWGELATKAEEVGRVVGGLRASVERRKDQQRASA
jgi:four helix bundle protein